jgi:pimeloyl-ACP methyl ester carboxylesterase
MTDYVTSERGDRIGFDRYGSGPAVVFVAGAGPYRAGDQHTTETAQRAADLGVTTLVYDRLGRGDSRVDGPITLDRELAAVAAVIGATGGEAGAALCGHSSGCAIALAAAASGLPVTALVLFEAPIGGIAGGASAWAEEFTRRLHADERESALQWYMKDMPPEWFEGAKQSPGFAGMLAQLDGHQPDAEALAWTESAPLSELLGGIHVPVEALVGEQSLPVMPAAAEAIAAAIPGATHGTIAGAYHQWEVEPMAAELARFVTAASGS